MHRHLNLRKLLLEQLPYGKQRSKRIAVRTAVTDAQDAPGMTEKIMHSLRVRKSHGHKGGNATSIVQSEQATGIAVTVKVKRGST